MMSGMSGGSMLRTRRKDANVKPNRRLDRKSSRGMLYENEELRLRTININAEVERGQSDIKKLKRENEQLRREVGALRGEYDRLERLLKARHQPDNSDPEGSGSCCSDCESECCNVQNNVNAASDVKKKNGTPSRETKAVSICENEGPCSMETCGLPTCGKLSAVPEESILRVPFSQPQNAQPCNCQCVVKTENIGFVDSTPPIQDYFTAVVTVPVPSHLPDPQDVQLAPSVYPKTGLDILINNNAFENFEGFTMAPPIGFIIPSTSNCEVYDKEAYQIVPNVDFNNDNLPKIDQMTDQQIANFNAIQNGNSINELFNSLENVQDKNCEDSYFVCNTKKVIQQIQTVQNTNIVSTTNLTSCNCSSSNAVNNPDIIIVSSNSEVAEKPSFITEKNIELNYDYPKTIIFAEKEEKSLQPIKFEEIKSQDITQTTHTTTEVNSTVMVFGRKNPTGRERSKTNMFARSHSAPVGAIDSEPIYATVQKLPKKLKRLNIRKLENEIKYIPPEAKEDVEVPKLPNTSTNTQSILKSSDPESPDCTLKSNGTLPKLKVKLDSFSESSDKNDNNRNSITKSPVVRKKKRFSIHFKRKGTKKPTEKKSNDAPEVPNTAKNEENKNGLNYKCDSDRLLEHSSSIESPDTNKYKDSSPTFVCKKHKKQRHTSRHDTSKHKQCPANFDNQQSHQCDKCTSHRKHPGRRCEHSKNNCSPVRNYFKNDSYQEITTSHSERERTNSLSSSGHSGFSLATNKSRKMSAGHQDENIPWCGCWGNSCL